MSFRSNINILNTTIDNLSIKETLQRIEQIIENKLHKKRG